MQDSHLRWVAPVHRFRGGSLTVLGQSSVKRHPQRRESERISPARQLPPKSRQAPALESWSRRISLRPAYRLHLMLALPRTNYKASSLRRCTVAQRYRLTFRLRRLKMAEGVSFALTRLAATPAFRAGALLDSANLPMAEDAGFPPALPLGADSGVQARCFRVLSQSSVVKQ